VRFCLDQGVDNPFPLPSIAGVHLSNFGGAGHFIAILGRADDKYVIGDPLQGRRVLPMSALQTEYAFTGLFIRLD
jgi:hypothetical protein